MPRACVARMQSDRRVPRPRLARVRDWIVSTDPGRFALRMALRATLGVVVAAVLLLFLAPRFGQSATVALVGAMVAMMGGVMIMDATPAAQLTTLALSIITVSSAIALATLVGSTPWLSGVVFCAIVFVAALARSRGPRGSALGMLAFMGYYYALYVQATRAQLPWVIAAAIVGGCVSAVIRFAIVRERPSAVHAHVLRAFRARVRELLDRVAAMCLASEARADDAWLAVRRATGRVDEAALALEDAAGETSDRDANATTAGSAEPAVEQWLASLLRAEAALDAFAVAVHRRVTDNGSRQERARMLALVARVQAPFAENPTVTVGAEPVDDAQLAWALETLHADAPWRALPQLSSARSRLSMASFRAGGGGNTGVRGMSPGLRLAIQSTVAVALSLWIGRVISSTRWYWAVIASFVVFVRSNTVGETLSRVWQRALGTALGVAVGFGIAALIGQSHALEIGVGIVAIFAAYYLLRISYVGMIVGITVALVALYDLTGRPVTSLLSLRLVETLAGVMIGLVVSTVVVPAHSHARLRMLLADVARAASDFFSLIADAAQTNSPPSSLTLHRMARRVDRALAEVRNAVRPFMGPNLPVERTSLTHQGRDAAALAYTTRRLTALFTEDVTALDGTAAAFAAEAARIAARCRAVAEGLEQPGARRVVSNSAASLPPFIARDESGPVRLLEPLREAEYILARIEARLGATDRE